MHSSILQRCIFHPAALCLASVAYARNTCKAEPCTQRLQGEAVVAALARGSYVRKSSLCGILQHHEAYMADVCRRTPLCPHISCNTAKPTYPTFAYRKSLSRQDKICMSDAWRHISCVITHVCELPRILANCCTLPCKELTAATSARYCVQLPMAAHHAGRRLFQRRV
jgi:hypothetical protein